MPSHDQSTTTVTRRSALRTGGLVAIMAGLLGTTTAPGAAAPVPPAATGQPSPLFDLVTALCAEPTPDADARFEAWLVDWKAERTTMRAEHDAILDLLKAYVPEDRQFELVGKLSDTSGDLSALADSLHREMLFRHVPGLEPVLRLVWLHVMTTHLGDELECGGGFCKDGMAGPY